MSTSFDDGSPEVLVGIDGPVESVVVVGAGMAGLAVGNALAHAGVPVTLVEARARIGGRTHTADVGGAPVDLGAAWIHTPVGNPMTRLADELGVGRRPWDVLADAVGWDWATGELVPAPEFRRLVDAADAVVERLEALRSGDAADTPIGGALDREVAADAALDPVARARTRSLLHLQVEGDASGPLPTVSLAHFPTSGLAYDGAELGDVPLGGYRQIVTGLADGLDIRTGVEVTSVVSRDTGVHVVTANGEELTASHVVVTVPLGVLKAGAVAFDPPLPADRQDAIDRLGFGRFDKLALRFDRPFWTEAGLPHVIVLSSSGPAPLYALLGQDSAGGDPVLTLLGFGSSHAWIVDGALDEAVTRALALIRSIVGRSVPEPVAAVRSEWSRDPFSRGAYSYLRLGSRPADLDLLGAPVSGRVLFAGEGTGHARVGYADGALLSGIREAKRLTGAAAVELGRLTS